MPREQLLCEQLDPKGYVLTLDDENWKSHDILSDSRFLRNPSSLFTSGVIGKDLYDLQMKFNEKVFALVLPKMANDKKKELTFFLIHNDESQASESPSSLEKQIEDFGKEWNDHRYSDDRIFDLFKVFLHDVKEKDLEARKLLDNSK